MPWGCMRSPAAFLAILLLIAPITSSSSTADTCNFKGDRKDRETVSLVEASVLHPHHIVEQLEVIFVLDPNFYLCWEQLPINAETKRTVLPWLRDLKDAFTGTDDNPCGNDLQVLQIPEYVSNEELSSGSRSHNV